MGDAAMTRKMKGLHELNLEGCRTGAHNAANMADFLETLDAEMKSFPWNFTEKYLLPDFLPSPGNIIGLVINLVIINHF